MSGRETSHPEPLPLLCRSIPSLSKLTVARKNGLSQNHLQFRFSTEVTVSDQTQSQIVAKALCALPVGPLHKTISCTTDAGIRDQLTFSSHHQAFPVVRLGRPCGFLQGLAKGQRTMHSPGIWRTLGAEMGIEGTSSLTFDGHSPNSG